MDWQALSPESRLAALREAGAEELTALVRGAGSELDATHLRQLFRNPFLSPELLTELAQDRRLLAMYEMRSGLATHPRTPQALALRFVPGLFWRDLLDLGLDMQVPPVVRQAADRYLGERMSSLAEGEKMSIARRASHTVLRRLSHDPSRRVISAVLENPRLTEALLFPLVSAEKTLPAVLALVAANPRWGVRYELRLALVKNPSTPLEVVMRLLPHLKKMDLQGVAAAPGVSPVVKRRARLLLGQE